MQDSIKDAMWGMGQLKMEEKRRKYSISSDNSDTTDSHTTSISRCSKIPNTKSPWSRQKEKKPSEVFRTDLITAMKIPDSFQLSPDEYYVLADPWRQEWEKGVQVPASAEAIPEPVVRWGEAPAITALALFKPFNRVLVSLLDVCIFITLIFIISDVVEQNFSIRYMQKGGGGCVSRVKIAALSSSHPEHPCLAWCQSITCCRGCWLAPGCSLRGEFAADEAASLPIPMVVIREHSEQISQATMGCSPVLGMPECCPAQCGCGTAVYGTLEVFMEELMAEGLAVSTWIISFAPHFSHVELISVDDWEQSCCSCSAGAVSASPWADFSCSGFAFLHRVGYPVWSHPPWQGTEHFSELIIPQLESSLSQVSPSSLPGSEISEATRTYLQGMSRYDLDELDACWLELVNMELKEMEKPELDEITLERVLEELETMCYENMNIAIETEEGLGIEYDEDVVCDVCRSPEGEDGNEMVFCDKCNVCVHQPKCLLCPKRGGALKPTRSGTKWVHVSCALWIPEVSIGCPEKMEPITKISHIPASRWALSCSLCKECTGTCIQVCNLALKKLRPPELFSVLAAGES
ncbi:hypothetical protein IHE44_0003783 [Lamprotornis superbus]|uniref:PHD-type domain-containing protein n=1 Tax=Lamprotornis superbus TaxID=245042 RepID=A0A835NLT5_9PASS|nr:hypothetical protein IHE44_0003783 [Lamprotornis superbus]